MLNCKKYCFLLVLMLAITGCVERLNVPVGGEPYIVRQSASVMVNRICLQGSFSSLPTIGNVYVRLSANSDFAVYNDTELRIDGEAFTGEIDNLKENTTYYYKYVLVTEFEHKEFISEVYSCTTGKGVIANAYVAQPFSVNTSKKVYFSRGNLQYKATSKTWRFAEHQYECIGEANSNISSTYDGWIDLFGWGTGTNPTLASGDNADYQTYNEWGANAIYNAGNTRNQWRTLTHDEWTYLLNTRKNAAAKQGIACVAGINGYVLLPDNWASPTGLTFKAGFAAGETDNYYALQNNYTAEQWAAMEAAGAVFLPAAGFRREKAVSNVGHYGVYWSSTPSITESAYNSGFYAADFYWYVYTARCNGRSVRLVQDAK